MEVNEEIYEKMYGEYMRNNRLNFQWLNITEAEQILSLLEDKGFIEREKQWMGIRLKWKGNRQELGYLAMMLKFRKIAKFNLVSFGAIFQSRYTNLRNTVSSSAEISRIFNDMRMRKGQKINFKIHEIRESENYFFVIY